MAMSVLKAAEELHAHQVALRRCYRVCCSGVHFSPDTKKSLLGSQKTRRGRQGTVFGQLSRELTWCGKCAGWDKLWEIGEGGV